MKIRVIVRSFEFEFGPGMREDVFVGVARDLVEAVQRLRALHGDHAVRPLVASEDDERVVIRAGTTYYAALLREVTS